jgi:chaperonin GroES
MCRGSRGARVQDRILIKVAAEEMSSKGGVILTSQSAEKPTVGEVIAVGPGHKDEKTKEVKKVNCKAGQQVLYSKYAGVELEDGDDMYVVVRESDILAVLS